MCRRPCPRPFCIFLPAPTFASTEGYMYVTLSKAEPRKPTASLGIWKKNICDKKNEKKTRKVKNIWDKGQYGQREKRKGVRLGKGYDLGLNTKLNILATFSPPQQIFSLLWPFPAKRACTAIGLLHTVGRYRASFA